jgi:predicted lipoprotein
MNRFSLIVIAAVLGVGLIWFFPLFHVLPLEQAVASTAVGFDAATFAPQFWAKTLVPSFELAHDAAEVITAIKNNPEEARKAFGKSVGIGRTYFYFLRGEGVITAIDKQEVAISVLAPDKQAEIVLKTGLLFGNAIRDATGQIPASDYANSQDFNAISKELNRIVQENVQPELKSHSQVGRKIRFVACTEVRSSTRKLLPLVMVPLQVEFPE